MKNKYNRMDKLNVLIVISFVLIGVIFLISCFRKGDAFDLVHKMNKGMVLNHYLIYKEETKNGVILYSVGKVNNGENNMYFVDVVKKTFFGYKWVGGGGHINRDIIEDRDFLFSAQLLNENFNVDPPILFGIVSDENIDKISLDTRSGLYASTIYQGLEDEKFYLISFDNSVSTERFFIFKVSYVDSTEAEFYILDEINGFQQGMYHYFKDGDIKN